MNVFLAFPFAGICDPKTCEVSSEFRSFFESLKKLVSSRGHTYFLAHEREDWGALYKGPLECVPADFNGVKDCDFLIVVPGVSGGVHIEIGWASVLKKDMHIFLEEGKTYSPVVHGLAAIANVTYHETSVFPSNKMLQMIFDAIKQEETKRL